MKTYLNFAQGEYLNSWSHSVLVTCTYHKSCIITCN